MYFIEFLLDPGKHGVESLGPDVRMSISETPFVDLTEVTLADEDTNSIPTDNVKRVIQGHVAMQVTQPGGHLLAKFATNASGAIWWPNLQQMQVAPSGGQICN